ncbi:MAG: TlpA disulfide reductase family protein [Sediminibacterium sp.]
MKYLYVLLLCYMNNSSAQLSGEEILKQSAARIKSLRSISYNIYSETGSEKANADVTVNRVKDFPVFEISQLKVSGLIMTDAGSRQVKFSSDGNRFEYLDPKTNELTRIDSATMPKIWHTGLLQELTMSILPYQQKEPLLSFIQTLKHAVKLNDTTVYTVACYKILVGYEVNDPRRGKVLFETILLIGKNDMLLYGSESGPSKKYIRIKEIDKVYESSFFTLASTNSIKTISGMEPTAEGLLPAGMDAPDWTLPSPTLKEINLSKLKGKVVLLDFWGTWCVPCIKAMPDIQAIADHFKTSAVEVIGVSVETEQSADPAGFMKRKGFTYPIALNGNTITAKYKLAVFPSIYIIDKHGKIIHRESGTGRENFKADIIGKIEKALAEN